MEKNQTIAQFLGITKFPFEIKNEQGKTIYFETSYGFWQKPEYDANGKETRYEDSDGYWLKREYDTEGNVIYYENSNGHIIDNRPKQVEFTLAEIASKLNIPLAQLRIKE
jgi:hypothetical protein